MKLLVSARILFVAFLACSLGSTFAMQICKKKKVSSKNGLSDLKIFVLNNDKNQKSSYVLDNSDKHLNGFLQKRLDDPSYFINCLLENMEEVDMEFVYHYLGGLTFHLDKFKNWLNETLQKANNIFDCLMKYEKFYKELYKKLCLLQIIIMQSSDILLPSYLVSLQKFQTFIKRSYVERLNWLFESVDPNEIITKWRALPECNTKKFIEFLFPFKNQGVFITLHPSEDIRELYALISDYDSNSGTTKLTITPEIVKRLNTVKFNMQLLSEKNIDEKNINMALLMLSEVPGFLKTKNVQKIRTISFKGNGLKQIPYGTCYLKNVENINLKNNGIIHLDLRNKQHLKKINIKGSSYASFLFIDTRVSGLIKNQAELVLCLVFLGIASLYYYSFVLHALVPCPSNWFKDAFFSQYFWRLLGSYLVDYLQPSPIFSKHL